MELDLETIWRRRSVRSFDGTDLSDEDLRGLAGPLQELTAGPFGTELRFVLLSAGQAGLGEGDELRRSGKIGTYGLLSKVPAFLVGAAKRGPRACEDFGFAMEGIILAATGLGFGTCWIGGLFDRGAAARAIGARRDEFIPAVVALGRAADRATAVDTLTRRMASAGSRKPSSALFFDAKVGVPLEMGEPWRTMLEAVRQAPSASNKQPWRILRTTEGGANRFHFLLDEDRFYNSMLGETRLQNIDLGIGMRHFEVAAKALGRGGAWRRLEPAPVDLEPPFSYITSWVE